MSRIIQTNDKFIATLDEHAVMLITIVAKPYGAMTVAAREQLTACIANAADEGARCIVLTGQDGAFSAGSNIREFETTIAWIDGARRIETALNHMIETGPVPVIAACNGHTLGGGAVMALACDFRIAGRSATFGLPEVKLGAIAGASGTVRLPALIGRGEALKLMLTGEKIGADEAHRIGIFQEVVDDDALIDRAMTLARQIAAVSPMAVAATRKCVAAGLTLGVGTGLRMEEELMAPLGLSADAVEGKAAFVEKRQPRFA